MIFNSLRPCFFWPVHAISQHHAINISLLNWPRVGMKTPFSSTSLRSFFRRPALVTQIPAVEYIFNGLVYKKIFRHPRFFPPNIGLKPVGSQPRRRPTRHHSAVEAAGTRCSPHALRHCAWKGLPAREDIANNAGTTWES